MITRLALAGTVAALSILAAPPGAHAAPDYAVQVKERPARIHGDGSVTVVFWLRCQEGDNAFESSAGIRQGDALGGTTEGPVANLLPCDGTRHRHAVDVLPEVGEFRRGYADLSVGVQIFPGGVGGDISAEDGARVWLKR